MRWMIDVEVEVGATRYDGALGKPLVTQDLERFGVDVID
jgi:hypothetical protein